MSSPSWEGRDPGSRTGSEEWRGTAGYNMGKEGKASDGHGSEFGPHPEGESQPSEQESVMRKGMLSS